jgi:hypothetical protein
MEQKQTLSLKHKFNLTALIQMEEVSKLTFPVVLCTPVLDSRYKNAVVSQARM